MKKTKKDLSKNKDILAQEAMGTEEGKYEKHHIGVLDGIRAVAVLIIVWYHFWLQSWIMPVAGPVDLNWLPRNGSILVDMMILLSGFCLFLPYARQMVYGEKTDTCAAFYVKRVARIAPSYYAAIAIALAVAFVTGGYGNRSDLMKDLIPHLTFLQNWFHNSLLATHLNGVLWTVAVEVQFYIFFPLLARCFMKKPFATYWGMTLVGLLSCFLISHNYDTIDQGLFVNNTLTFACVYANGMLGAWLYVSMTANRNRTRTEGAFFTVVALACMWVYKVLCEHRMSYSSETKWQVDNRYLLSLVFLIFLVSTIMASKWFRAIWDNRVMSFLAGISFNLYICHQDLAVRLKLSHIPPYEGDVAPNQLGDKAWQWKYLILCIVLSFAMAVAMTYLVEKPAARAIKKLYDKHRK